MAIQFPNLCEGQFALIHAEANTGIVIFADGKRLSGLGEAYLIFDSIDTARNYAREKIMKMPEIECRVYDHENNCIETIRN